MAIIRTSAFVQNISGKIGGTTFQTGGGSPVIRRKTTPRPRTSQAALKHKALYSKLTHQWRALTEDERHQWNYLAEQTRFPNRLGQPRQPTGRELFFRESMIQEQTGLPYGPIPTESTVTPQPYELQFPLWQPEALIISWTQPASPLQVQSAVYARRTGSLTPKRPQIALQYLEHTADVPGGNITIPLILAQGTAAVGEYINCAVRVKAANRLWSQPTTGSAPTT